MNQKSDGRSPGFTPKQGQYLAFIDACHFVAHFVAAFSRRTVATALVRCVMLQRTL
jgi:hypothetical protein